MKPFTTPTADIPRRRAFPVSLGIQQHRRWPVRNIAIWSCFGMILLFASISMRFTHAAEAAPGAQSLVIEFEYHHGIRQEILVAEGTKFEVTTHGHGEHLKASGRIGRVHDEQVELELSLSKGECPNEIGAESTQLHYENLLIGRFQLPGSALDSSRYLDFVWVRREFNPVPELLASLRRLDKNSLHAALYIKNLHGDADGLVPELVRVAQGHAADRWQAATLQDDEWQGLRRASTTALGQVGQGSADAVRVLQALLKGDDDDGLRIAAAVSLWRIAKHPDTPAFLVGRLNAPDRISALIALAEIGSEAPSSGPAIVPLLNDPDKATRNFAAWALWRTTRDPRAVDTLIAALKDGDMSAGEKLGLIGYPAAQRAAPLLAGMIYREYPYYVAKALRQVDPDARQCLPLIVQAVSRNDGRGADAAGKVLASYGTALLPALRDLLQEGDEHAWKIAISALGHSAPDPAAVDTLVDALQNADPQVRSAAASSLGNIVPGGMEADLTLAIPALVKLLNDDDKAVRVDAGSALLDIGQLAVPAVQYELKHGNERTRPQAEEILKFIRERAEMDK